MSQKNTFPNGYALLIGVDKNDVESLALPGVARDLRALHKVLADPKLCAYLPDNIQVIGGDGLDPTRANILAGLAWLKDKLDKDGSGDATAVVYYSGHGHKDATGHYLVPRDVKPSMRGSYIKATDFAADITDLNPRRLLVLLDCCFAAASGVKGGALESLTPSPINEVAIPADVFLSEGSGDRDALEAAIQSAAEMEGAKGGIFDALAQDTGRMVISASQADQKSWLLLNGSMSVFTYHLIEALTGHAGAMPLAGGAQGVGVLNVALHVDVKVPETVRKERDVEQRPDFKFTGMNFPLALVRGGAGASKGTELLDPIAAVETAPEPPRGGVTQTISNSTKAAQISGKNNQVSIS